MQVLSNQRSEHLNQPKSQNVVEVVDIQSGSVRIGIAGPEESRLNGAWKPLETSQEQAPTLPGLQRLVDKRLEIAREGINEVQALLRAGMDEDARIILEKVDEDLHLLRRRLRREFEKVDLLSCVI